MFMTRVLLLIFVLVLVAFGVCAALFPLMRLTGPRIRDQSSEKAVYLWYEETKFTIGSAHYFIRDYHRNNECGDFKTAFIVSAALHVAACCLGAITCLLAAAHLCSHRKFKLCCSIVVLCFVTFACFATSIGTVIFLSCADTCVNDNATRVVALRDQGYFLSEGFIFLCVAGCGFFMAVFLEVFS
ncbi:hypothetical protein JKF63_05248 [Porcisia hertigi]|uniref:Uncharacterized protein n=1 Tax=Porcisia hertigi TaxID=2761500 RepID=A0A836IYB2_9TRYP|nr:hypothetical protein JKF63_05248 [Porcisia hertigi]